ncbi:MAG: FHA domain-containing protein [Anaerolineae bacterium]|nr:FHA domain-containing protein [Anaerolineae bacterium]
MNGARIAGVRIAGVTPIGADDVIQIGDAELRFTPAQDPSTQTTQTRSTDLDETVLEATMIDNKRDLEQTVREEAIDVVVPNTHIPRVAVQFEGRFWEVPLTEKGLTIGRAPENDIVLNAPKVSRNHARIELRDTGVTIIDNRSANGTFIGDEKITRRALTGARPCASARRGSSHKPAFSPSELGSRTKTLKARKPIVFIPGFMGSQLWLGDKLVWPNLVMLATQTDVFKLPEKTPLTVRGLVEEVVVVPNLIRQEQYSQLTDFLRDSLGYEMGKDLLAFAYDWRKDLRLAANQLKQQVEAWRKTQPDPEAKVILIAHSMGSLVTRYFLDVLGGDQITERVIFMGGPHMGTPKSIVALLTGQGLLPFGLLGDQIRDAVSTFPGAYQLLPIYPRRVRRKRQAGGRVCRSTLGRRAFSRPHRRRQKVPQRAKAQGQRAHVVHHWLWQQDGEEGRGAAWGQRKLGPREVCGGRRRRQHHPGQQRHFGGRGVSPRAAKPRGVVCG